MNITQENVDELNAVLKVKLVAEDYLPKVEQALKDHQKKASMPGFRPGKVPKGMIKKMYGKSVLIDAINNLLNDSLTNYLQENKVEVLGNPLPKDDDENKIDWDNQKEFEFSYDMGLAPKFEVNVSSSDKFEYNTVKIDDELVNKYVSDMAKRYGKVENKDTAEEGDLLNGDFVELDDAGEIKSDGIFKTASIFLERVSNEETKKALLGLKKEEKVTIAAQDLSDNAVDLAAMLGIEKEAAEKLTANIQFTVKNITHLVETEINQELFDKLYGEGIVKSEEEFRNKVKEELSTMFVNDSEQKLYNNIVEHLLKTINPELPTEFLKRWILTSNEKPVTPEQVEEEFEGYSKGLKWQLIENKIIKDNNIEVSNDEVIDHTKKLILDQFGKMNPTPMSDKELDDTVQRVLSNQEETKKLYEKLYGEKVMTFFKSKFTIENKELPYDDFFKK